MTLHTLTIHEAGDLLRSRDISAVELTTAVLDRMSVVDDLVRAYITRLEDRANQRPIVTRGQPPNPLPPHRAYSSTSCHPTPPPW